MLSQESNIAEARTAEENYDWLRASELHRKRLESSIERPSETKGELPTAEFRRIISCLIRASFQSNDSNEFEEIIRSAIVLCERAAHKIKGIVGSSKTSSSLYFSAQALLLSSWIAKDPGARQEILEECLVVANEGVVLGKHFENQTPDLLDHSLLLLHCLEELWVGERKAEKLDAIITKGMLIGRSAIEVFENRPTGKYDMPLLAETCYLTAWFCGLGVFHYESFEKRSELLNLRESYWKKFDSLADEISDPFIVAKSLIYRQEDYDPRIMRERAYEFLQKILPTGDNLLIAGLLSQIPQAKLLTATLENPEIVGEMQDEVDRCFNEAITRYNKIVPIGIHWECLGYSYELLGAWRMLLTTSPLAVFPSDKRLQLLDEGFEISKAGYDKLSGYTHRATVHLASNLSYGLWLKAKLMPDKESKLRLLEDALDFSKISVNLEEIVEPHRDWDFGMMLAGLADVQSSLAILEESRDRKIEMIKATIGTYSRAFDEVSLAHGKIRDANADLGDRTTWIHEGLQDMWRELYEVTGEESALVKRLELLQQEARVLERTERPGLMAMDEWKIGFVYSLLGDHSSASRSYGLASESFSRGSQSNPQLRDFYIDYANYMKAWQEIENARFSHYQEDYLAAGDNYACARNLLEMSKTFVDLAPHYEGWVHLERAENLSRTDSLTDIKQSIIEFTSGESLFSKSYEEITRRISLNWYGFDIESPKIVALASSFRRDYCHARVRVEDARLLYRNGQKLDSMDAYNVAAKLFEKLSKECKSVSESKEVRAISLSCQAWAKILEAETYASPELYDEAAALFLKVRNLVARRAAFVSEGNSKYCTALRSMLEFKRGSRIEDYISGKSSLEEASAAYANAGFRGPVGWISATERLIDAFVYVNSALKESNPQIRARNFSASEKLLDLAGSIFETEGYSAKKNEVENLRRKMKAEKELALSLNEIFTPPSIVSSTESFNVPPSGLVEPFENSRNLQSSVQIAVSVPKNFNVGESFDIKIDIINSSEETFYLHRIEDFIPENFKMEKNEPSSKDFEIDESSQSGRLILLGKSLSALSVRSIAIKLRAMETTPSEIPFSPKIFYSSAKGEQFEKTPSSPVLLTANFFMKFEFDNPGSGTIFDYLVKAFIEDYMVAKTNAELSGWRTIPQIIREAKLPSFSVYSRKGGVSPEVAELTKRGIVEKRVSTGERGRGGVVLRMRIAYDRDAVKSYIDERIRKRNEKR